MAEERSFVARTGGAVSAVAAADVWAVLDAPEVRLLPGARGWCGGWILYRDQVVPVLGGAEFGALGEARVVLVLQRREVLLGLPCQSVDLRACGPAAEGAGLEGPLPSAGIVEFGAGERARRLDAERLYSLLGIQ